MPHSFFPMWLGNSLPLNQTLPCYNSFHRNACSSGRSAMINIVAWFIDDGRKEKGVHDAADCMAKETAMKSSRRLWLSFPLEALGIHGVESWCLLGVFCFRSFVISFLLIFNFIYVWCMAMPLFLSCHIAIFSCFSYPLQKMFFVFVHY